MAVNAFIWRLLHADGVVAVGGVQELDRGILFPRFSSIQAVSVSLTAAVAEQMVRAREGTIPDDFDAVPRPAGASAWEAYVRSKMFKVPVYSRL